MLLLVASALPIAAAAVVEYYSARTVMREQGAALLRARADEVAEQVDLFHEQYQHVTERMALIHEVQRFAAAPPAERAGNLAELLARFAESDRNFRGVGIFDASGTVIAATELPLLGRNYAFRGYFAKAVAGTPATSEIYTAVPEVGSVPSIAYAAPVRDAAGAVVGVAALWVRADAFWSVVKRGNDKAGQGSYSVLVDSYGVRVAHSLREDYLFRPTEALQPAVIEALVAERRFGDRTRALLGAPIPIADMGPGRQAAEPLTTFAGYSPANDRRNIGITRRLRTVPWTLFYLVPEASVDAPAIALARKTALWSALIIVLSLAGGLVFAGRIAEPVLEVARAADALAAGDLAARANVSTGGELGRLGSTFNRMADALASSRDDLERTVQERTAELYHQKSILDSMVHSMGEGVIVADEKGRFLLFNPMAEHLLGVGPVDAAPAEWPERYGAFALDGVTPIPAEEQPLVRAIAGHDTNDAEIVIRNAAWPAGVIISVTGRPLRDTAGATRGGVVVFHDVTARKRAEEELSRGRQELEDAMAQLASANHELEAFSYSVSHDLRAPLRHVSGFVDLLRKRSGASLDETGRRHLDTIGSAAKRMGQLIDDLLAFSRMGRAELMRTEVDLGAMVAGLTRQLSEEEPERQVQWLTAPLPPVLGDPAMLRVVLTNLLGNALKYTRGRAHADIAVGSLPTTNGEVTVFVRDNGAGFDMQYVHKLFGVFQRLHRSDEFEGTGIGLAIVRRVVHRHGGRTWAEGVLDGGATFFFTLPAAGDAAHGRVEADPAGRGQ